VTPISHGTGFTVSKAAIKLHAGGGHALAQKTIDC